VNTQQRKVARATRQFVTIRGDKREIEDRARLMQLHDAANGFDIHFSIFGVITAYDACDLRCIAIGNDDIEENFHEHIWPMLSKRWRVDDSRGRMWHCGWEPNAEEKELIWRKSFDAAYLFVLNRLK
jgi:hypothetical protein